jgi:hypothetical protein
LGEAHQTDIERIEAGGIGHRKKRLLTTNT